MVDSEEAREDVERYNTARMKFATELYSHFLNHLLSISQRGKDVFSLHRDHETSAQFK